MPGPDTESRAPDRDGGHSWLSNPLDWPHIDRMILLAGLVLLSPLAFGTGLFVTLRLWPGPSRKYQTRFQAEDGRDPEEAIAEVSDAEEARAVAEGEAQAEPSALDRDTAIDSWDELSRGDDPTR